MSLVSKNVYIDKLADKVNKYNNTYHSTIKMMPVDVKPSTYLDFNKENNKEAAKFEVSDHVRTSEYKNISAKCCFPIGGKKFLWLKKLKALCCGVMLLAILIAKKLFEIFYEKKLQKTNRKEFRGEKGIKRKVDKLYIKWKGYNTSFNCWID